MQRLSHCGDSPPSDQFVAEFHRTARVACELWKRLKKLIPSGAPIPLSAEAMDWVYRHGEHDPRAAPTTGPAVEEEVPAKAMVYITLAVEKAMKEIEVFTARCCRKVARSKPAKRKQGRK